MNAPCLTVSGCAARAYGAPAARSRRVVPAQVLEWGLTRHPLLTYTAALLLVGFGLVAAVCAATFTVALPLALLFGLV